MAKKPKQKPVWQPPPAIVRKHLAELASGLQALRDHEKGLKASGRNFAPMISSPAVEFVLAALAEFEAGERLDRAFGLTRRGRPRLGPKAQNYELAKEVFWKHLQAVAEGRVHKQDKSWIELAKFYDRDVRYLQRLVEQYGPDIIAEATAAINSAD
jgi:hypothetical protein